jgi:hypothetical protein
VELFVTHDTDTGRQYARKLTHFEEVLTPVTSITVKHGLDRRFVRIAYFSLEYFEITKAVAASVYCGDDGSQEYYCRFEFNSPFTGVIRIDY